jgi:peroxiredoxin Q/BCP
MKTPSFTLPDQNNKLHSLEDYLGKWVVVYFYPKDDTPGCTMEACSFRDYTNKLTEKDVVVLGISKDSVASHKKFEEKYNLNFTLLSDEGASVAREFGAVGEKSMFGKKYVGVLRKTFLVDPEGIIRKEYPKVTPREHAAQILKDLETMQ